jgi:hypothetical protein
LNEISSQSGHHEERLPFIYIWLPPWFKQKYPQIVQNLITNRNRLTTPFDLHMTLKHILELSGRTEKLPQALNCPQAQSLFETVPWNRSCDDACIETHWCTCTTYKSVNKNDEKVQTAIKFAIDWMNKELDEKARNQNGKTLCSVLKLSSVSYTDKSEIIDANTANEHVNYLVKFRTWPSDANFETTIIFYTKTSEFKISGEISRLNSYGTQSSCVNQARLKLYCLCNENLPVSAVSLTCAVKVYLDFNLRKLFNIFNFTPTKIKMKIDC